MNKIRCSWCGTDPLYVAYHDEEWGKPVHDDRKLFEFLTLEGAQAGLSWITVLRKRENYRKHFFDWDIELISKMTDDELEKILLDEGIIRNRLKVYSVRKNAIAALKLQKEFGSLDAYFWNSSHNWIASQARNDGNGRPGVFPIINHPKMLSEISSETEISKAISKDLKKRGMSFIGSTIIYAFMQAVGLVDDHIEDCFCKTES
ncbi:DNA-3-methyladenine glycosylase I [Candidatus Gracilibacteria bacterium]|nr:DNA-3-methyladenine glycosylase I [Candidatus Gracilibacteria bacterium]